MQGFAPDPLTVCAICGAGLDGPLGPRAAQLLHNIRFNCLRQSIELQDGAMSHNQVRSLDALRQQWAEEYSDIVEADTMLTDLPPIVATWPRPISLDL